jgi:sensor domain CHASE-containing protein
MPTHSEKIAYLENSLNITNGNYADSFKVDIVFFIDEFDKDNTLLEFLKNLLTFEEIDTWIEKLTSRIVLKFDPESEQLSDFIFDYIELG